MTHETKHTPGPWWYDDGEKGKYFPHVVIGGDNPKAGFYITVNTCGGHNGGQMSECQANARLIAAAPELLKACTDALWILSGLSTDGEITMTPEGKGRITAKLRAAIAKAEGRTA